MPTKILNSFILSIFAITAITLSAVNVAQATGHSTKNYSLIEDIWDLKGQTSSPQPSYNTLIVQCNAAQVYQVYHFQATRPIACEKVPNSIVALTLMRCGSPCEPGPTLSTPFPVNHNVRSIYDGLIQLDLDGRIFSSPYPQIPGHLFIGSQPDSSAPLYDSDIVLKSKSIPPILCSTDNKCDLWPRVIHPNSTFTILPNSTLAINWNNLLHIFCLSFHRKLKVHVNSLSWDRHSIL